MIVILTLLSFSVCHEVVAEEEQKKSAPRAAPATLPRDPVDWLEQDIFQIIFMPLPIRGLDSSPVNVMAIVGVTGWQPGGVI